MKHSTLADLPPELLDHIVAYIPTASCLASLAQTSHSLQHYIEESAWSIFARTRFPTTAPAQSSSWKSTVRTLTSRNRAWARRGLVARFVEPSGPISVYPGAKIVDRWKRPTGQTVGFTPRLDAYAVEQDQCASTSTDVLAYSAGAQIVLRKQTRHLQEGRKSHDNVQWATYRPLSAVEGRDDVSTLHLIQSAESSDKGEQQLISGTANGDLQHLSIPFAGRERVVKTYFTTQGRPVQSSSISPDNALLAASLGHTTLALYKINPKHIKKGVISEIDVNVTAAETTNGVSTYTSHRIWSTQFLGQNRLAVGLGPSTDPLRVFEVSPSGLSPTPLRSFQLRDTLESAVEASSVQSRKSIKSSVYPITSISGREDLFYSGAYDGVVRLHDLRSPRAAEMLIQDGYDDSAIYSLLLRGQETLIAGTSRHSHLKVFDARMNAKAYSYLDIAGNTATEEQLADDFSLYLSTRASSHASNRWRTDGSIYSLASATAASPYMYAGVQNGVIEIASTEILHPRPDPLYFESWPGQHDKPSEWNGWAAKTVLNVARYEAGKMNGQKNLWDTWQTRHASVGNSLLDARWKGVKAIDLD